MYSRLPGSLLAHIRRSAEALMTETCVLERPDMTRDEYGSVVPGWVAETTTRCRVITAGIPGQAQQVESGGKLYLQERWRLMLPAGVTVGVGYRVRVQGAGEVERIYRVVGLSDNLTDAVDTQAVVERWRDASE